jgi:hypothetical protein
MKPIIIRDAAGLILATIARRPYKRISMRAAQDHREMDSFARSNPAAASASIGETQFIFRAGRSQLAPGQI